MNYANQLCQCFISLKVQVQLALHCVICEAYGMGYGCYIESYLIRRGCG